MLKWVQSCLPPCPVFIALGSACGYSAPETQTCLCCWAQQGLCPSCGTRSQGRMSKLSIFFWAHLPLPYALAWALWSQADSLPHFCLCLGWQGLIVRRCTQPVALLLQWRWQGKSLLTLQLRWEYSTKAWVLPLRASTRSPCACPLQCRGPKDLYMKPNLPSVPNTTLALPAVPSAPQTADCYVHGKVNTPFWMKRRPLWGQGRGNLTLILWEEKLGKEIQ